MVDDALPAGKAEVDRSLGLQLSYQPNSNTLRATRDLSGGVRRVKGGV